MSRWRAHVPYIPSMGSVNPINCNHSIYESREEQLLWELNKMREHDHLPPLEKIPDGVRWEEIEPKPVIDVADHTKNAANG